MHCTFHVDKSLKVNLTLSGSTIAELVLKPSAAEQTVSSNGSDARVSCAAAMDFFAGALTLTATVAVPDSSISGSWTSILDIAHQVVLLVDPTFGMIQGQAGVAPPVAVDGGWGPSGSSSPVVTRMHVGRAARALTDAGSIVWNEILLRRTQSLRPLPTACGGAILRPPRVRRQFLP